MQDFKSIEKTERKRMKILVLSNEVWNDKINGNNVTTNWFEGMKAEFAIFMQVQKLHIIPATRSIFKLQI